MTRIQWKSLCTAIATVVVMAVAFVPVSPVRADGPCDGPATTILVVRHADRAGDADSLSVMGIERAQELVRVLSRARIGAIYHSDTRRTRDTAAPLAQGLKITPGVYPAKEVKPLIERILHDHVGETVLVVGHSNTVPLIIAAAGGPAVPDIDEFVYDDLYVVHVPRCGGDATLTHLKYGKPSH
ncbi:MAG TPA: phosphoglycerate mutase family protein [Candidatus Krumholzibacteria bacterium]